MREKTEITLTRYELQSGQTRQQWAEGLIEQLPAAHEGRNSWLLNYGVGEQAQALRATRGIRWNARTEAAFATTTTKG